MKHSYYFSYLNINCFNPNRKFVVDAMPMVGTTSSVQLMKTLISNDDVTGQQADMWLASLAFIQHPTEEMINQVEVLLHDGKLNLHNPDLNNWIHLLS